MATEEVSGVRKAAMLLMALGPEISIEVMKYLREEEIEQLTIELASMPAMSSKDREKILAEFHQTITAKDIIIQGGVEYAREILNKVMGKDKAEQFINRTLASLKDRPFENIKNIRADQLATLLRNEHPQTVAVVLSYLPSDKAAATMEYLPQDLQTEVVRRIANMAGTDPKIVKEVEKNLEERAMTLLSAIAKQHQRIDGMQHVVDMLNETSREMEKTILESLSEQEPELAEEIKKRMFTFEDFIKLDDRSAQRVLREVDLRELAIALKGVSEKVKEMVFRNMPKRTVAMLKEEMEFLGAVRASEVEENQQKIINLIKQLEDAGEIVVARGGKGGDRLII